MMTPADSTLDFSLLIVFDVGPHDRALRALRDRAWSARTRAPTPG